MFDIHGLIFYLFAALLVAAALGVVSVRNPVYAVLLLIFCFFNAAGLFVLLGAEYIAMTLVIVYVGAVAILFLFVVMMLDVRFAEMKRGFVRYLPIVGGMAALIFLEIVLMAKSGIRYMPSKPEGLYPIPSPDEVSNVEAIGRILYTDYAYPFQVAGLILLVAMIGAIVLTLRQRKDVRKQSIYKQVTRKREEGIEMVDVKPRSGI